MTGATCEAYDINGRLHYVSFALDSRDATLPGAALCLEDGVTIEAGPHEHAV